MSYMQKGDIGVQFNITLYESDESTVVDLTNAENILVWLQPPLGDAIAVDGALTAASGTDGVVTWVTALDDQSEPVINQAGTWSIQIYWEDSSNSDVRRGTVQYFDVYDNLG